MTSVIAWLGAKSQGTLTQKQFDAWASFIPEEDSD